MKLCTERDAFSRRAYFRLPAICCLAIAVVLSNAACDKTPDAQATHSSPSVLKIGVLPDESYELLNERYRPLVGYLEDTTGVACELVVPESYARLGELFHERRVDLAYFGGMTFLKARESDGAAPVVMRAVDTRFTSYFVIRADESIRELSETRGMRFSFGSRLSTSGHLMPRHFLVRSGISPETFYSAVRYSGAHDRTVYDVCDGTVDIGVANSKIVDKLLSEGRVDRNEIRVLWETPPYADYVWAIHPEVSQELRARIRLAFLELSGDDPKHAKILEHCNAEYFVPASVSDFADLERVAMQSGHLRGTE